MFLSAERSLRFVASRTTKTRSWSHTTSRNFAATAKSSRLKFASSTGEEETPKEVRRKALASIQLIALARPCSIFATRYHLYIVLYVLFNSVSFESRLNRREEQHPRNCPPSEWPTIWSMRMTATMCKILKQKMMHQLLKRQWF
jgi:hypothetical protein